MSVICVRVQTRQSNQFPQRQSNQFLGMRSPALYGVPSTGMTETTSKTNRRKLRVTQRLGRGELTVRASPGPRLDDSFSLVGGDSSSPVGGDTASATGDVSDAGGLIVNFKPQRSSSFQS
ncbi:hypothetical protein FJT64_001783 [Amphibalanus amphitrite]|uniref:Uncharacterized protein n=1 Tax=Amphibalanus amphitrite TaxID=1232801 RepID=A0A6A4WZL8_AMPAM|nr:hypothetical protein FJT64_001783 [Amphibalanus amphitrite]